MHNLRFLVCTTLMMFAAVLADDQAQAYVDLDSLNSGEQLVPVDGISASGQPDAEQLALFSAAGYVAVVDLRGESEDRGLDEAAAVEGLGMDYVTLPISNADAISWDNATKLEEILASYAGPVLVHCGSGNRVGALLALSSSKNGADDEDAVAYGRAAGLTGLESVVRSRLAEDE